jgi:hypothetical protein
MKSTRRSFLKNSGMAATAIAAGYSPFRISKEKKVPVCLLIDDSAPLVHVYWYHVKQVDGKGPFTKDGRVLVKEVPNSFLDKFCDVAGRHGMAGKISIVPAPGGAGNLVDGIPGYDNSLITEWLNTAKKRLSKRFDFSPEMLTHNRALDLKTGTWSTENEAEWSMKQDRTVLTPYIENCLNILKKAGINASGVTSPWNFGVKVEGEYTEAMLAAQKEVYNHDLSWYFLHALDKQPEKKPWIALKKEGCTLVSIASNMPDNFWQTIDSPETSDEYVRSIADKYITADGREGSIINVLNAGGWPVFVTHWQSLFSNGLMTGLKALEEVGKRIDSNLKSRIEWKSCMELARLTTEMNQ